MEVLPPTAANVLLPRQSTTTGDPFLDAIANPFNTQFETNTIISAVIISLTLTILIALLFCFLRPYNSVVYAPRAKHADSKHAPPVISKGPFDWILPLSRVREADLVDKVGLDGALFMRFTRMLRNLFVILTVVGCGVLIPFNLIEGNKSGFAKDTGFLTRLTPQLINSSPACWIYVVVAYVFDGIIFFFLWLNYKGVLRLRRTYFDSHEYQRSLHARTLLITDIPGEFRSDEGVIRIVDEVKATQDTPRAAIARNVKGLPDLVDEHEETVRQLEKVLAKYLKNPDRLPARRPTCKPSKNDKGHGAGEVDAIEYLTARIKHLEMEIKEVRETVDKRNAMSYGFATFESIPETHNVAYAARKSGPHKTSVRLAPRPNDLVWKNLGMTKKARDAKNFTNNLWTALLTVLWIVPNILMAAFLSNLSNIGKLSSGFEKSLMAHSKLWSIVQAVVAPAVTTLFYFYLPAIFRKMCINAGDVSKTSRDRHVTHKLYSFFVFNNLIVFSVFSTLFSFVATVVQKSQSENAWEAVKDAHIFVLLVNSLCTISPYWISWLLQRNMGAAIDLSQLVSLLWGSMLRRFGSPTPRELIELTAPQPFDFAGYYNYFLFYATVAVAFAPLQPLVLPVVALYFWMDSYAKKYLLLYIFITKYESGGMFWRSLFNRMLFCAFLGNVIIALLVTAKGSHAIGSVNWGMLAAMAPLPFGIAGFKWYCMRTFDDDIHFYQTGKALRGAEDVAGAESKRRKGDRVGVRFGHPVLFKPLMTPMVSAKSQHLLKSIYTGRTSLEDADGPQHGYGDVYMDTMDMHQPGKQEKSAAAPFEIVGEHEMDFEHYKNRPEFRDEAGGDGQLFGRSTDHVRSNSPHSMLSLGRTGTSESLSTIGNAHNHSRSISDPRDPYAAANHSRSGSNSRETSRDRMGGAGGMEYPRGYHPAGSSGLRDHSPAGSDMSGHRYGDPSRDDLVGHAAGMGRSTPLGGVSRKPLVPGLGGLSGREQFAPSQGYGPVPGAGTPGERATPGEDEPGSYDYFRRGRGI